MHENINRKSRRLRGRAAVSHICALAASRIAKWEWICVEIFPVSTHNNSHDQIQHTSWYTAEAQVHLNSLSNCFAAAAAHMNVIEISNVHKLCSFFFRVSKRTLSRAGAAVCVTQIWTIFFCVCKRAPLFLLFHVKIAKSQQQQYNVFVCRSW